MAPSMQIQARQRKVKKSLSKAAALIKSPFTAFKNSRIPATILSKLPKKVSALVRSPGTGSDSTSIVRRVGFSTLPGELRNKIWETVIEVEGYDRFCIIDTTLKRVMPVSSTAVSPLLSVNRESRSFALKAYPQTIPIRKIRGWELHPPALTTPLSGLVPVVDRYNCGVYRYNLETDKFICGMRYCVLPDPWKLRTLYATHRVEYQIDADILTAEGVREQKRALRLTTPLCLRYTTAVLPEHNTRDYPQVQNVIGLQPWHYRGDIQQFAPQENQTAVLNTDGEAQDEYNYSPSDYPMNQGDDTIGPYLRNEYEMSQYFPDDNEELNALFPGRCFCSSPDFNEDGFAYQYCYCVHISLPETWLRGWMRSMRRGGMPAFRRSFPELVIHGM